MQNFLMEMDNEEDHLLIRNLHLHGMELWMLCQTAIPEIVSIFWDIPSSFQSFSATAWSQQKCVR